MHNQTHISIGRPTDGRREHNNETGEVFTIKQCFMDRDHWRVHWLDDNHTECFAKRNYNGIADLRHVLMDRCGFPMSAR